MGPFNRSQTTGLVVVHVMGWRSQQYGSFEHFLVALSRTIAKRGGQLHLVFPDTPASRAFCRDCPAYFHVVPSATTPLDVRFLYRIARLLVAVRATHVHAHYGYDALMTLVAARALRVRFRYFTKHNTPGRSRLADVRHRVVAHQVGVMFAVSVESAQELRAAGVPAGKVHVVYLGTNVSAYHSDADAREAVRRELGLDPGVRLVLSASHLRRGKGVELLPEVAGRLVGDPGDVAVVAAGDGPLRAAIEREAASKGLDGTVFRLLGTRQDIARLLAAADVFVLPTNGLEGLPLSVLEAMAAETPVVATDVSDLSRLIGSACRIVPPNDIEAITEACRHLLTDCVTARALGQEARRLVTARFSVDEAAAVYTRHYVGQR